MLFEKDRKRRIIYNDDSDQQYSRHASRYNVTDEQTFIDARTTPTFDTHVDTYVWCVGNGCEPPWGAWGETRYPISPVLGSCEHATNVIVHATHARGMEVWGSLRINDLHDSKCDLEDTNDPLKAEHPEYLIGKPEDRDLSPERVERSLWSALNFERLEVRQYRLDYIERNASAHDFDGYELDFTRFIWTMPQGRERELAPLMTDFIRQARARLNAIGARRGRPYTFVVHVSDSVETSLLLGQDVEAWLAEGLIDVLVVGMGFMPFTFPLDQWKALSERYGIPLYPSLNTRPLRRFHQSKPSAWHHYTRAAAAWWWHNGADGTYLFNLFTHEAECGLEKEIVHAPLHEIGNPAALAGKDKLYGIESLDFAGMFSQGSEATPLPLPLDIHERRLPLSMGPDADDPTARFEIHALTRGGSAGTRVLMRLNHTLLEVASQDGYHTAEVPADIMRVGRNNLAICCNTELSDTANPIIVHEILTSVLY